MSEILRETVFFLPLSILLFIGIVYVFGKTWTQGKIILGDFLKFFGWTGKKVRKLSVENEYEGTINSIINSYNKNFESPILPNCKIQWVTSENKQNILKEDEAIICLSFDKKDHNLNFYNATLNFVQTSLIAKSKNYLNKTSSKAIDLLTTHIILKNNRREVLTVFNEKWNEFDEETRREFESLVPTNENGLFLNLLLPELHYYGELIEILPPSSRYSEEANGFLQWFVELATREFDERTNLKYTTANLKVGVILVGKEETWESQGAIAYTKWADYYAAEDYNSVYILARGDSGYERASTVTKILTETKGFDQLNNNTKIKCYSAEGDEYIVTCYSLRPNRATISYLAWEKLKEHDASDSVVPAIVDSVQKEFLTVNVFGLRSTVPKNLLSAIDIADARRVFKVEDELYLKLVEFDSDKQYFLLSNKGTQSDPKIFIDATLNSDKVYSCKVKRIQMSREGYQNGLIVETSELDHWIYIPKSKASPSRFLDLTTRYHIDSTLNVLIQDFNSSSSNFVGRIEELSDPWRSRRIKNLESNKILSVTVKQINELIVIGELEEGVECWLHKNEISWDIKKCNTSGFKIDETIRVKVIDVDIDRRRVNVSIKRLTKTPDFEYYEANQNREVKVKIVSVIPETGIAVKYPNGTNTGFIPWFEIAYGSVGRFENLYQIGDEINVVVSGFDDEKNSLYFSIKRGYTHQFENWIEVTDLDAPVRGKVIEYLDNSVRIDITNNGFTVQAFIILGEISSYAYIHKEDLQYYLPIGETFPFYIFEINEDRETIALTRKEYLEESKEPDYGEQVSMKYVKENKSKGYLYSEELEGWISNPPKNISLGSIVDVIPVRRDSGEYEVAKKE